MKVAVLTISDSSFAGTRPDVSGPEVAAICASLAWQVAHTEVLPDDRGAISACLRLLSTSHDLILTTGGTGITARDVTPEATADVVEKELPGLPELMRAAGLGFTRRAALSRAVAGTLGQCLIVNLPGSPKGARQSLDAILDLVPHIVELLHGRTAHAEEPKRD
ncbi:MAG: MogA/MoaB family molybdenum cofactor biosynthesis protein [Candidatus Solibacter usitatus]|nr:MogA/MoaB family molybdenum cofactor biosynthesis protein [Candidatus Solibacter usitatus]